MLEKELDQLKNKLNFYKQHQKSKLSLFTEQRTLRNVYSEHQLAQWGRDQPSPQTSNTPSDLNHYSLLNKALLAENSELRRRI